MKMNILGDRVARRNGLYFKFILLERVARRNEKLFKNYIIGAGCTPQRKLIEIVVGYDCRVGFNCSNELYVLFLLLLLLLLLRTS